MVAVGGFAWACACVWARHDLTRPRPRVPPAQIFVSLNPTVAPDPALTHKVLREAHPQFTPQTEEAQRRMTEIQGVDGLWFCGAWMGHG